MISKPKPIKTMNRFLKILSAIYLIMSICYQAVQRYNEAIVTMLLAVVVFQLLIYRTLRESTKNQNQ